MIIKEDEELCFTRIAVGDNRADVKAAYTYFRSDLGL